MLFNSLQLLLMLKGYEAYNTINILGRAINERALKITFWGVLMGRGAIKLHFLINFR